MKITTPVKGYTGEVAGVAFVDGVGQTDDPAAIAYFRRHAYVVEDDDQAPAEPEFDPTVDRTPEELRKLRVKQLVAYAGKREVDLGGATKKDDILAALGAGEPGTPDGDGD